MSDIWAIRYLAIIKCGNWKLAYLWMHPILDIQKVFTVAQRTSSLKNTSSKVCTVRYLQNHITNQYFRAKTKMPNKNTELKELTLLFTRAGS